MGGVNSYSVGRFISKKIRMILFFSAAVTISFMAMGMVTFFAEHASPGVMRIEYPRRLAFLGDLNFMLLHCLMLMEGFMSRNLLQIVLTSVFNSINFGVFIWGSVVFENRWVSYLYLSYQVYGVLFNFCILGLSFTLTKEFGWFYYKEYGADKKTNIKFAIRKSISVVLKISIIYMFCFWILTESVGVIRGVGRSLPGVYAARIGVYYAEEKFEHFLLRLANLGLSLYCLTFWTYSLVRYSTLAGTGSTQRDNDFYITLIVETASLVVAELSYAVLIIMDSFILTNVRVNYGSRQRKRMVL